MEDLVVLEGFMDVTPILRCGIYALVREGVVVYVGQSKRPLARIEAHRSLWGRTQRAKANVPDWLPIKAILFDEVHVMPCRVEDLDRLERALIDLYKPKFNVKLKSPQPVTTEFAITVAGCVIAMNAPPARNGFVRRM